MMWQIMVVCVTIGVTTVTTSVMGSHFQGSMRDRMIIKMKRQHYYPNKMNPKELARPSRPYRNVEWGKSNDKELNVKAPPPLSSMTIYPTSYTEHGRNAQNVKTVINNDMEKAISESRPMQVYVSAPKSSKDTSPKNPQEVEGEEISEVNKTSAVFQTSSSPSSLETSSAPATSMEFAEFAASTLKDLQNEDEMMEESSGIVPTLTRHRNSESDVEDVYISIGKGPSSMAGFLRREVWTIPVVVFACLNLLLIVLFETYVLCHAKGHSRRHLFLGQILLFGLFLCSSIALVFTICPSIAGCFISRLGLGVSYSVVFSVLIVKCVFLLSLNSGVYLPVSYQALLLFFSMIVQVALDVQRTIIVPPILSNQIEMKDSKISILEECGTSYTDLLFSLSYVVLLIIIVGVLAIKAKSVRENYRESTYISMIVVVTIPIWISWISAGWIFQGPKKDASIAIGLIAQSLATFLIMFMPKGRQLAALGKEGLYLQDQEDQYSGYSPSFFHFKPTGKGCKAAFFGDGNVYTTLEPTLSTINPNVFFHRSDLHSGMIY